MHDAGSRVRITVGVAGGSRSDAGQSLRVAQDERLARRGRTCRKALLCKESFGAGDGNRTHDIQLGKLTFYL